MKINELASSFLHVKESRDEEKRVLDYDLKNQLQDLQKGNDDVQQKLKILAKKDEIEAARHFLEARETELKQASAELLAELKRAEIKEGQKLEVHVRDSIYFSVWYDQSGEVYSAGTYHKM
jgi:hypothetical protein